MARPNPNSRRWSIDTSRAHFGMIGETDKVEQVEHLAAQMSLGLANGKPSGLLGVVVRVKA